MIVKYDSLDRFETPKFTLCNPGSVFSDGCISKVVGILNHHEAEEIIFNFNTTSELNLRINWTPNYLHDIKLYDAVKNRRLIFVDDIGYFMITSVEENTEGAKRYKDVSAESIDVELQQRTVPYIEDGTYRFCTNETETEVGIFNKVVDVLPMWKIGYIDDVIASKFRTFEDIATDTNCLSFLINDLQDAFDCIVLFDIKTRTVNVYDQDSFIANTNNSTDIHLSNDDLIKSLQVKEDASNIYTALRAMGNDEISINAVNPVGGGVIYDFTYYLDWMSNSLAAKVAEWQKIFDENNQKSYYDYNLEISEKEEEKIDAEADETVTRNIQNLYYDLLNNIIADIKYINSNGLIAITVTAQQYTYTKSKVDSCNAAVQSMMRPSIEDRFYAGEYIPDITLADDDNNTNYTTELNALLASIRSTIDEFDERIIEYHTIQRSLENDINALKSERDSEFEDYQLKNYFTEEELKELDNYIFEGEHNDEYVTITDIMSQEDKYKQYQVLYERAIKRLHRVSMPTQEFQVDVENFIFVKDFERWSNQLETGCLINVETRPGDVAKLFLTSLTINYEDHDLSLTFGNRFNKFDTKSLFDNVLGEIKRSANSISFIKEALYPIKNKEIDKIKEALATSRTLTMGNALTADNEEVIINSGGYTGRRRKTDDGGSESSAVEFEDEQIKITSNSIVFTRDGWESAVAALGKIISPNGETVYGLNAETIIGDLILGRSIRILDSQGNDKFSVTDNAIQTLVAQNDQTAEQYTEILQTLDGIRFNVKAVDTGTGFTFDSKGLTLAKIGSLIKTNLNNDGMVISRFEIAENNEEESGTNIGEEISTPLLEVNNIGVNALNLTSRQYLNIGDYCRIENYSRKVDGGRTPTDEDKYRTACYFISPYGTSISDNNNVFDPSTATINKRLNSSNQIYPTDDSYENGYFVTDYIPCDQSDGYKTLRILGASFGANSKIVGYNSNGDVIFSYMRNFLNVTTDSNGVSTLKVGWYEDTTNDPPTEKEASNSAEIAQIRLALYVSSEEITSTDSLSDVVVTLDEIIWI